MTTHLPEAVLLDLDDTILDTSGQMDEVWRWVCETFARRLNGVGGDELFDALQEHRRWFWSDPERHRRGRLQPGMAPIQTSIGALQRVGVDDSSMAEEMASAFTLRRINTIKPVPGAIETLKHLRERNIRLALVTNGGSEVQRTKIERAGLDAFFDYILIEGEFGVGKPDPSVYSHVLEQIGATPEEAWMVGDDLEWEVAAPQKLGIFSIWVDAMGAGLPDGVEVRPDRVIRSLAELL